MKGNQNLLRFSSKSFVIISIMVFTSAFAEVENYQIKKGDKLSVILFDRALAPLYGRNGFVKKVIKLNRNKIRSNGDFVRVGIIIKIPTPDIAEPAKEERTKTETVVLNESRAPSSDEFTYSRFVYSPYLSFLKMDSTNDVTFGGSNVSALSKSGVGMNMAWQVFYDDRFSFFGFGAFEYFSFYSDPDYSLNKASMTRLHFGVGGGFEYSPELKLISKISLREISFLDVQTPTLINLESISVPEIEMGLKKSLFTKKKLKGVGGAHLLVSLPNSRGNYKSKLGYGAGVNFEVIHNNKSLFLNYDYRSQKVNEIKNKESSIMFGMNFFGDNVL